MGIWTKKSYRSYNTLRISKSQLQANYTALQALAPDKQLGVILKSNAYGHGIPQVLEVCNGLQVPYVIVDSTYEALVCQDAGATVPILVMGFTAQENLATKKYPFSFVANDERTLNDLVEYQSHAPLHIFINTGMNREGFGVTQVPWLIEFFKRHQHINWEGVMSHFAQADVEPESESCRAQKQAFANVIEQFAAAGINFRYAHIDAAPSVIHQRQAPGNFARIGKAFYGVADSAQEYQKFYHMVSPALEFVSTIVSVYDVKQGDEIGYGGAYHAQRNMKVALIPAGYQEGVSRELSNRGVMLVRGKQCPIVGRVSMNYTSIDVSGVEGVAVDDEVIVYSKNPEDPNSMMNVSTMCDTIPHEMMVRMDSSVRRVIID